MISNNMQILQGERLTKQEIKERLRQMKIIFDENSLQKTYYVDKYDQALQDPKKQMMIMDKLRKDDDEEKRLLAMKRERRRNVDERRENGNNDVNLKRVIIESIPVEAVKNNNNVIHSKFSIRRIPMKTVTFKDKELFSQEANNESMPHQVTQPQCKDKIIQLDMQKTIIEPPQEKVEWSNPYNIPQQNTTCTRLTMNPNHNPKPQIIPIESRIERPQIMPIETQSKMQQPILSQLLIHPQPIIQNPIQRMNQVYENRLHPSFNQYPQENQVDQKEFKKPTPMHYQSPFSYQSQPINPLFKNCANQNDFEITKEIRQAQQRQSIQNNNFSFPFLENNDEIMKPRKTFQEKPRHLIGMSENDEEYMNDNNDFNNNDNNMKNENDNGISNQHYPLPQIIPIEETKSNISNFQMLSIGFGVCTLVTGGYYCIKNNRHLLDWFKREYLPQAETSISILTSFQQFFQNFISKFSGISAFFRNPFQTILSLLWSCIFKLGKKVFVDHLKTVISLFLIKMVVYFIWKQIKNRMVVKTIFNEIKEELKNISENNDDIYAGLSENEIVKRYSLSHDISETEFQRTIMPKLRVLRAKDDQIKEFEDVVNGKIQRIWQY